MGDRTIIKITINNQNKIVSFHDFNGIEDEEEALRMIHSILDELRMFTLNRITYISQEVESEHDELEF